MITGVLAGILAVSVAYTLVHIVVPLGRRLNPPPPLHPNDVTVMVLWMNMTAAQREEVRTFHPEVADQADKAMAKTGWA